MGMLKASPTDLLVGWGQSALPAGLELIPVPDPALMPPHMVAMLPPEEKGDSIRSLCL